MAAVIGRICRCEPSAALRAAAAGALAVLVSAVLAASAFAGTYQVYSCRTPSGQSAPVEGWSPSKTGTATVTEDTCEQGGALVAGLKAFTTHTSNADEAVWAFAPPADATLASAVLWRAGDTEGGWLLYGSYQFWLATSVDAGYFDECVSASGCSGKGTLTEPLAAENRVVAPPSSLRSHLYAGASCGGLDGYTCPESAGDPNGFAAAVYLYAADLTLEQTASPSASNVTGELASASVIGGTSDVAFSASDPGSGVYEAVVSVDGQVVQTTALDENGGRCKSVEDPSGGPPAFLYLQPCAAAVNADVGFDTTKVSNGAHHLVVSVTDAAGNSATVLDRDVTVDNPAPAGPGALGGPNGTNASAQAILTAGWTGAKGARMTSGYGHAETIVGRLTDASGAPIAGAQLGVLATPRYLGAKTAAIAGLRTDADGRFTLRLPAGSSSRTLRVEYSDQLGGAPVAVKTLTLSVRAGVSLDIAPRIASVGRSIRFAGRLPGGPIPSGGKLLVLEARSPGGAWLEFDVVRTDARGRYRASYRFKFPGPASYQFRVLCQAEADYPFATGASRTVGVYER